MVKQLYYEYAMDGAQNRKRLVRVQDVVPLIEKARKRGEDLYLSTYLYTEEIVEHLKIFQTCASYRGQYATNKIIFDIDGTYKKEDKNGKMRLHRHPFDTHKRIVVELCCELMDEWELEEHQFSIWFSGRGFHIQTPNFFRFKPSNKLPQEVRNTIMQHFPMADDSIYIATGLIRAPYTLNVKSNLYKFPIDWDVFKDIDKEQLEALATSVKIQGFPKHKIGDLDHSDKIVTVAEKKKAKKQSDEAGRIVTCVQKMFQISNFASVDGGRHKMMLVMISTYKRQGVTKAGCFILMKDWAARNKNPNKEIDFTDYEIQRRIDDVFDKNYMYGCQNEHMAKFCDAKCIFYKNRNYTSDVYSSEQVEADLKGFMKIDFTKHAFNLADIYPISSDFMIYPGDFVLIWGETGLGKSAVAQNIAVGLPHMRTLYLTLEYPMKRMYRRFVQMKYGLDKRGVEERMSNADIDMFEQLAHINMLDVAPYVTALKKIIVDSGANVVIIDTLGDLETKDSYGDPLKQIVPALKKILQDTTVIIIAVHHLSKSAAVDDKGKFKKLTLHSGIGSSTVEHKANVVLGLEPLCVHETDSTVTPNYPAGTGRVLRSLKASDETPFSIKLTYQWQTFRMIPKI